MADTDKQRERERLTRTERTAASIAAVLLLAIAVWMILDPPNRTVALQGCKRAADGCLVTVDGDPTTIAAALFALAAVAGLVGLLGVRFTSVKAGGVELSKYEEKTEGLPTAVQEEPPSGDAQRDRSTEDTESPVRVQIRAGLGTELGIVPVAVASLDTPMAKSQAAFLRDYQGALRNSRNDWFLTHILGPARSPRQKYSVAIKVTPHNEPEAQVKAARFFLGRAWGYRVFDGKRGADGRFGISTEAYGPFLALCEVEFTTGERVLLDHYCDFEMGALISA
jgi:hypothetical protein